MKPFLFPIAHLVLAAFLAGPGFGQESETKGETVVFRTNLAAKAQARYRSAVETISKHFLDEMDRSFKIALQAGLLEDANLIDAARKQAVNGGAVTADLKRPSLVKAREQYQDGIAAAKMQYLRDLEPALKGATTEGDLDEANGIAALRKSLEAELAERKMVGTFENGLWLMIGDKEQLWENEAIMLPSNQTPVTLKGTLLLSGKVRNVRLRSTKAGGSERLRFTANGKLCDFEMEGSHRFVTIVPLPGAEAIRLELGNSIAANEWEFGPLEWSINEGNWREIPLRSLLAVD